MAPKKQVTTGPRGAKRQRQERGQGSRGLPEATPLTPSQQNRILLLNTRRTIKPSRWINADTIDALGIQASTELLLHRVDLWDFLSDEVPTFQNITTEFLASLEYDRAEGVLTFNLGGLAHRMTSTELMDHLGLSTVDSINMTSSLSYQNDMNEATFRRAICEDGILNSQRARNILHPTLRYIQRVMAYTIFGRGETASIIINAEFYYLYCMLRRNNKEMNLMPHLGHNLAKHLYRVGTNSNTGHGEITCGGIITKLATALGLRIDEDPVEGPTNLDLAGLQQMRIIEKNIYDNEWLNVGPGTVRHELPLEHDIDPFDDQTWKIVDEPVEPQIQVPPQPQQQGEQQAPQQGGPSMQDLMNFMVGMKLQIDTIGSSVDAQGQSIMQLNNRFDTMEERIDEVAEDAAHAKYYASQSCVNTIVEFQDDPPTPPKARRMRKGKAAREHSARMAQEMAEREAKAQEDAAAMDEDRQ